MANTPLIGTKNKKGQVFTDPNQLFLKPQETLIF